MKKATRITLAAAAITAVAAAGVTSYAIANGDRDGWHSEYGEHHGRWGKHHRGKHGRHGAHFDRLFERFDSDQDGKLTQAEIDSSREALLAKFDADGNGTLALEEFQQLWLEVMAPRMVRGFQQLDEDGDASVTLSEFLDPYSEAVERMDRNGDGALSKEDRRRGHHRHQDNNDD